MSWYWALITILLICTVESSYKECFYKRCICNNQQGDCEVEGTNLTTGTCEVASIFQHELTLTNKGELEVTLGVPGVECYYKVALVVNETIRSEDECQQLEFDNRSNHYEEIHGKDRSVCVAYDSERENPSTGCKNENIVITYKHIFTGCYALRFTIDGDYTFHGRKYIETSYNRTEVQPPEFGCIFDNREMVQNNSDAVTFTLEITLHSDTPILDLILQPLPFENTENERKTCGRTAENVWSIDLVHNVTNCDSIPNFVACRFPLEVPFNCSYEFEIQMIDHRCLRDTLWKPPMGTSECVWSKQCTRVVKTSSPPEYPGGHVAGSDVSVISGAMLIPVAVSIILLLLVTFVIIMYARRWHNHRQQAYLNANLRELRATGSNAVVDGADVIDTDDETKKGVKDAEVEDGRGIVLLYARGSTSFMSFMSEFREILKVYCKCHVFDWYAACEWNTVAKVGASDWAMDLLKKDYRAVWIDTPGARSLVTNRFNTDKLSEEAISDFRDMAFSAVLDYAKRSVLNTKLQYSRHFIVRLEGLDNGTSVEDPFSDLSPHARYLIPYHLSQLCSHLSSRKSDARGHALMTEEAQLRERLIQIKNDI